MMYTLRTVRCVFDLKFLSDGRFGAMCRNIDTETLTAPQRTYVQCELLDADLTKYSHTETPISEWRWPCGADLWSSHAGVFIPSVLYQTPCLSNYALPPDIT